MKTVAHVVACNDADILPFSLRQLSEQVDNIVVAIGETMWNGYPGDVGDVQEQVKIAESFGAHVITGTWNTQEEHRTACIRYMEQKRIVSDGDLHVLVDSDELWMDGHIGRIVDVFRNDTALMSLAAAFYEFWSKTRVRCSSTNPADYFVPRMRFWRHTDGCRFTGGNTLSFANGKMYPDCAKGDKNGKHTRHVLDGPYPCHHYEATRPPWRMRLKYYAFEHRRRNAGVPMRPNFYGNVWVPWQLDHDTVESTELGISTETRYKVSTTELDVEHPEIMEGYEWLD